MKEHKDISPIVQDVRRVRGEIMRRFDYDVHKYAEFLRQQERSSGKKPRQPKGRKGKSA